MKTDLLQHFTPEKRDKSRDSASATVQATSDAMVDHWIQEIDSLPTFVSVSGHSFRRLYIQITFVGWSFRSRFDRVQHRGVQTTVGSAGGSHSRDLEADIPAAGKPDRGAWSSLFHQFDATPIRTDQ